MFADQPDVTIRLLELGSDVSHENIDEQNALDVACRANSIACLQAILTKTCQGGGAAQLPPEMAYRALLSAAGAGHQEALATLIRAGLDVNLNLDAHAGRGTFILSHCQLLVLERAIGYATEKQNSRKLTALCIQCIMSVSVSPKQFSSIISLINFPVWESHSQTFIFSGRETFNFIPLNRCISLFDPMVPANKYINCIPYLLPYLNPHRKLSGPALHAAVEADSLACVLTLLSARADVELLRINTLQTPLTCAAELGNPDIARALLLAGCDVNRQTENCSTALTVASHYGQTEVLRVLLGKLSFVAANINISGMHSGILAFEYNDRRLVPTLRHSLADVLLIGVLKTFRVWCRPSQEEPLGFYCPVLGHRLSTHC